MGLAPFDTHPLGNTSQFHPFAGNPEVPSLARHNEDLGIDANESYFGFSCFSPNVDSGAMTLTDISTFPLDTAKNSRWRC